MSILGFLRQQWKSHLILMVCRVCIKRRVAKSREQKIAKMDIFFATFVRVQTTYSCTVYTSVANTKTTLNKPSGNFVVRLLEQWKLVGNNQWNVLFSSFSHVKFINVIAKLLVVSQLIQWTWHAIEWTPASLINIGWIVHKLPRTQKFIVT